jgi:hypothetical protein
MLALRYEETQFFFNYIYKKFWISGNSFRKFFGIVIEAEKYSCFDFFFQNINFFINAYLIYLIQYNIFN